MATIADYPDAVDRIVRTHVGPGVTSRDDVLRALRDDGGPQVTPEVAANLADAVLTEDRVIDAIESSGEVPSQAEIDAITNAADDYDHSDRQQEVADAIRDRVATAEDIDRAVESKRPSDRPMFREDVEAGVDDVTEQKELRGASRDEVALDEARERGAPSETSYNRAAVSAASPDSAVSPSDLGIGSQTTSVNVIEDSSGDPVLAFGGAGEIDGQPAGQRVADELGAEYAGSGTEALEQVRNDFGTSGTGDRVDLTFRGRKVGEVDVS